MPLMDEVPEHDLNADQQQFEKQKQEEETARRKQVADNFVLQRQRAVGNMLQLANDIAAGIDDPVEATQVTAEFYQQVADMFADGQRVAADFISQSGANQAQVHELESRAHELEQELRTVQDNQDDLIRGAERASDLQVQVRELGRENIRLKGELEAEKADHQEAVNALRRVTSEKDEAVESSAAWQSRSNAVEEQLNGANARITELQEREDRALDAATHWRHIAVRLGYVEPDSADQPDAPDESATGNQPAVEEPAQGDEPSTRLIDPENGQFAGTTPSAEQSDDEAAQPQQSLRNRLKGRRRSRRSGSGNIPEQHRPDEGA